MTKFILIFLSVFLFGSYAAAQTQQEKRQYRYSFWFDRFESDEAKDEQNSQWTIILQLLKEEPHAEISIIGWADKVGSLSGNTKISLRRAETIRHYLIAQGINPQSMIVKGNGVDPQAQNDAQARRADLIITTIKDVAIVPKKELQELPPEPEKIQPETNTPLKEQHHWQDSLLDTPQIGPSIENYTSTTERPIFHREQLLHQFSLRTNLLYWLGGLINLGAEWKPIPLIGVVINGGYAPWESEQWRLNWGGWFVSPELRFYLGRNKHWFIGGQFLIGQYNLKPGDLGRQGSVIAGGVIGGYKLTLSSHFDMDLTLGAGYGELRYKGYRTENGIKKSAGNGFQSTVLPIQAGVNFIWKIR